MRTFEPLCLSFCPISLLRLTLLTSHSSFGGGDGMVWLSIANRVRLDENENDTIYIQGG
jgi:hypothetical protein